MQALHGLWTIPPGHSFLKRLAGGLCDAFTPADMAKVALIVPQASTARALCESIESAAGASGTLLPQTFSLRALGEILKHIDPARFAQIHASVGPVIAPLARQTMAARLIQRLHPHNPSHATFGGAFSLAGDLLAFCDMFEIENLGPADLKALSPDDAQTHWQDNLAILEDFLDAWPGELKKAGSADPYVYENAMANGLADAFQAKADKENSPLPQIILAGSTGTAPRTRQLMQALLGFAGGCVVLPGFDPLDNLDPESAENRVHPARNLTLLLKQLDKTSKDVRVWPDCTASPLSAAEKTRHTLVANVFGKGAADHTNAFRDITLATLPETQDEALFVALAIRQSLEVPGKTVALVASDAGLKGLVRQQLRRWGIVVPASTTPFQETPLGAFVAGMARLMLLWDGQGGRADFAATLLGLMKNAFFLQRLRGRPFPESHKNLIVRKVEQHFFRNGVPFTFGPLNLGLKNPSAGRKAAVPPGPFGRRIAFFWRCVGRALDPLSGLLDGQHALRDWMDALGQAVHNLVAPLCAQSPETLLPFLSKVAQFIQTAPAGNFDRDAFLHLLQVGVLETPGASSPSHHPRIRFLSPQEGRLVGGDTVILGGMNEGGWPPTPPENPWLGLGMQQTLGLPSKVQMASLSAHDFAQSMAAETVILTRSKMSNGVPQNPSMFWRLLKRFAPAENDLSTSMAAIMEKLAEVPMPKALRPRAKPPISARPRRFSPSALFKMQDDPYAFYAEYILKLSPAKPLCGAFDAANFGTLVHRWLEVATQESQKSGGQTSQKSQSTPASENPRAIPVGIPTSAGVPTPEILRKIANDLLAPLPLVPAVHFFWRPGLLRLVPALSQAFAETPSDVTMKVEAWGQHTFQTKAGTLTLYARADRLDIAPGGSSAEGGPRAHIIDYKTGTLPSRRAIRDGKAPQLALEGALWLSGGFSENGARAKTAKAKPGNAGASPSPQLAGLSFWHLKNGALTIQTLDDPTELCRKTLAHVLSLVRFYQDPENAYLAPFVPKHPDPAFAHLARAHAWNITGT